MSGSKLQPVTRKAPCPVCQKTDWCGLANDSSIAICMRIFEGSVRESKNGGFVHVLKERERKAWQKRGHFVANQPTNQALAPVDRRNVVFTELLESLILSGRHSDDLMRRGLHDTFIANNLFASVPGESKAKIVCDAMASRFDLREVPGFFQQGNAWRLAVGDWCAGYFVPVRDLAGRIQALQIRRDNGDSRYVWLSSKEKLEGTTSGAPGPAPAPASAFACRTLMRWPSISNHAPGNGDRPRICRSTSRADLVQSMRASAGVILCA